MDDHYLRVLVDPLERLPYRILPAVAPGDDQHRLCARAQIHGWIGGKKSRERDDDLGDYAGIDERVDAALEDGAATKGGELLRLLATEAQSSSTRGNDCGNVSAQGRF